MRIEDRHKLQDNVLITLGTMTVNFSALENILSNVAAPLLRSGRVSIIVASQLSFSRMLTLIAALAKDQLDAGALRTELLEGLTVRIAPWPKNVGTKSSIRGGFLRPRAPVSRSKSIVTRRHGLKTETEQVDL